MNLPNIGLNVNCNSNCTRWCPRKLRVWCCCCRANDTGPYEVEEKVDNVGRKKLPPRPIYNAKSKK